MSTQRKQYSVEFKARVALEALKGLKTVNALASAYGVHPTQIAHWKHRLHERLTRNEPSARGWGCSMPWEIWISVCNTIKVSNWVSVWVSRQGGRHWRDGWSWTSETVGPGRSAQHCFEN